MKIPSLTCGLLAAFAATLSIAAAAPADDVKAAAAKLADANNYSWATTTTGGSQRAGGTVTGQAEKAGFAVIKAQSQMGEMVIVSKGDKRVIKTPDGWVTSDEMRARMQGGSRPEGGNRPAGGPGGRGGMMGGQTLPAADVVNLLGGAEEFKLVDGAYVSEMSGEAIANQLRPGGRGGNQGGPDVKGTLKVWIKDGVVAKTELHITGSMPGRNGETRSIDRTTVTEFSNVGSTTVDVPAEAKAKLGE